MTGYFSVVTKLGRSGAKSMIHLYNLDPRHAAKVKEKWKFESFAWSFAHDSIIKEAMPFKAHFLKTPEAMKNLSQENKDAMKALEKRSGVVKSLGVSTRSDKPDSRATGKAKCQQALMRITQLSLRKVDGKALAIIINSLVVSIAQFAALEANTTSAECGKVDRAILNKVRRGFGLSQKDMKDVVFLQPQQLGMGVRSFQGTVLAAKARELECGLNGEMQYCTTLRARWQAWADRKEGAVDINRSNFLEDGLVESNVRMLARYGIYLRDRRFDLCNAIVDLIMLDAIEGKLKKKVSGPIGHYKFKKKTTGILGDGHDSLLEFSTFSPLFNEIRDQMSKIESRDTSPDWTSPRAWKFKSKALKRFNVTSCMLADYARTAISRKKHDVITIFNYAEWKGESSLTLEAPITALDWVRRTKAWTVPQFNYNTSPIRIDTRDFEESIRKEMVNMMRIDGKRKRRSNHGAKTVVLWAPYMDDNENFEDIIDQWQDRKSSAVSCASGMCATQNRHGTN